MGLFILLLAIVIGLTLGILGGGGSILTVPVLTYVVGVEPRMAIPMSLLIVGITAAFSTLLHHRKGHVNWKMGLVFAPAAMMGGVVGDEDSLLFRVLSPAFIRRLDGAHRGGHASEKAKRRFRNRPV